VVVAVLSLRMFGNKGRDMMAGSYVFLTSVAFFGFIAGNPSGHGITFWKILLYCSPLILVLAGVSAILGVPAKRRLIRRQLSATEFVRWADLIPSLILDAVAITGSLIFTVYALEECLKTGSTYHGDGWVFVFLLGTALLSPLIMIMVHVRLLSGKFRERGSDFSLMKRVVFAFQLGLVSPGAFAVVVTGLLLALSK
jgi:hypothetical protein